MIVLDTHVLVWWVGKPEKLSKKASQYINKALKTDAILASSISIWEICLLVKKKRLKLTIDVETWLDKIEELPFIRFIAIDNKIAVKSVSLPGKLHQDPADRMIIATALRHGAVLITSDKKILNYPHLQSIW